MTPIDSAGSASTAVNIPAAPAPAQTPTQTEATTDRPVEQNAASSAPTDNSAPAQDNDSNLGRNIDTSA